MTRTTISMITQDLLAELADMPKADSAARTAARSRADTNLRPPGSLAQLEDLAVWIAEWHGSRLPRVTRPVGLVFAGDHGVAADGVSAYPAEITAAMLAAVRSGQASINALADAAGAELRVIDVGVGRPTANLRHESALSVERFGECFEAGRLAVRDTDADLLVFGELGIGNTTAAAAVTAAIVGVSDDVPLDRFVGRGTGVDDDALAVKTEAIHDALRRIEGKTDPLEVLRQVGGSELVAMAGAIVEARARRVPVVLDGYICTAPALALHAISDQLVSHVRAGHRSEEPGHSLALARLGLEPILTMGFRLGEGSGAMTAVPLVVAACRVVSDVATFDEFFGSDDDASAD